MDHSSATPPLRVFAGWSLFFCGICMGIADLVPGISGGTVAFILGFYQPLLESLKTLNWHSFRLLIKGEGKVFLQRVAWRFLLTLVAGIACALASFVGVLHFILQHEVYRMYLYASFLGLILASFVFCVRQVRRWNWQAALALCLGFGTAYSLTTVTLSSAQDGVYALKMDLEANTVNMRNYHSQTQLLTGLSTSTLGALLAQEKVQKSTAVYNSEGVFIGEVGNLVQPLPPQFFNLKLMLCGALAICALLLPGISGSYILTLLGVYPTIIEALAEFVSGLQQASFHVEAFSVLLSVGVGVIMGAMGFARSLSWLMRTYPNQSLALLSGFMIGALRSVWPFWAYDYVLLPLKLSKGPQLSALYPVLPDWQSALFWQASLCTVAGFVLVLGLEAYAQRKVLRVS